MNNGHFIVQWIILLFYFICITKFLKNAPFDPFMLFNLFKTQSRVPILFANFSSMKTDYGLELTKKNTDQIF